MDTSSFLNGLERFVSRRGIPHKITCDNGLNFVRGSKELKEALLTLNHTEICNKLSKINVELALHTPLCFAPWWYIRATDETTVRQVLTSMLHDSNTCYVVYSFSYVLLWNLLDGRLVGSASVYYREN
ncbi:Uncharacterised protein r2_g862 [Pycnogonum litorale]